MVIEVLRSSTSTKSPKTKPAAGNCLRDPERYRTSKPKQKENRDADELSYVDHVSTNAQFSEGEYQLYIFEDNEAASEMIRKGRSPTMRHAPRRRRVALDWLFDIINLDSKIQIKYVDTRSQLADMLTKGCFFTRVELDHLLRLLNIRNFSMLSCSHFLSNRKQSVMSKRATAKGSAVAKPRPMNLVSRNLLSPSARFECFEQPRESRVGPESQANDAKQQPRPNWIFSTAATR